MMDTSYMPTRFHRKRAERFNKKVRQAQQHTARAAIFGTVTAGEFSKEPGERVTQKDILAEVDIGSATKRFDISLRGGPYAIDYSKNGRFLAYCGKSGNVAGFDWLTKNLLFEINVAQECKDIKFLHQETFIAVAEPKSTSIYDNQGIEVHCIKQLHQILRLEFLPYHFLLVASAANGFIYYLDCTVGSVVSSLPTYMGRLGVMCQNPSNGVIITGHNNGCVCMWIPSERCSVVKMFTHHSGLTSVACDRTGRYLATCALDRKLKVWDVRSTYDPLSEINLPISASSMDYSQRGLLAIGAGNTVQVLKDPHFGSIGSTSSGTVLPEQELIADGVTRRVLTNAYLNHYAVRPVHRVRFCPYEDVLGVGTNAGISSILCPGSAEPNYDALEENPFANKRYRQEREIKRLLDKIPHTMISLESLVGKVRREDIMEEWEKKKSMLLGEPLKVPMPEVNKNKRKGRSKPGRIEAKKQHLRLERKMFSIKAALGVTERKRPQKQQSEHEEPSKPSEILVSRKRLAKKRIRSALDVLIPPVD
ncbi:WD repeat-containing protein 46 [Clonorchis sinensis]|uniref:WD repeat-containing protein 46 n=1 Tax=Clonorchis sinensis TaxID=79923 RepID=A0A8T1M587_CLOSI|nr:WD repeat-containing protein 46 [Clonorchis sinensis]